MTMPLFLDGGGATFSPCLSCGAISADLCRHCVDRFYRYHLWRRLDASSARRIAVIGLNPSTADAEKNDPTIERLCRRARRLGFGRLDMLNVFAWRSTDPKVLPKIEDPIGPDNDGWILDVAREAEMVLCAWGNHAGERGHQVAKMLRERGIALHALRITSIGAPEHPLYLSYAIQPQLWEATS
jgi:hypothetical protein